MELKDISMEEYGNILADAVENMLEFESMNRIEDFWSCFESIENLPTREHFISEMVYNDMIETLIYAAWKSSRTETTNTKCMGIFGYEKRNTVDPEWIRKHFRETR